MDTRWQCMRTKTHTHIHTHTEQTKLCRPTSTNWPPLSTKTLQLSPTASFSFSSRAYIDCLPQRTKMGSCP